MAKNIAEAWIAWSLKAARNWAISRPTNVRSRSVVARWYSECAAGRGSLMLESVPGRWAFPFCSRSRGEEIGSGSGADGAALANGLDALAEALLERADVVRRLLARRSEVGVAQGADAYLNAEGGALGDQRRVAALAADLGEE